MNLQTIGSDIQALEKALRLVEKTENYLHFNKSNLIFELCEQINMLKEKRDKQIKHVQSLQS